MVPEVKTILFVTDLSQSSRHAFYYAASLASFYKAKIDILYPMEDIQGSMKNYIFGLLGDDLYKKYEEQKADHARSVLIGKEKDSSRVQRALEILSDDSIEKLREDKRLVKQMIIKNKETDVTEEIYSQCQQEKYDLIVASYKCFAELHDLRAGSKIKKTIKMNNIPLLLVPASDEEFADGED
ncbi:MAG: universal stress protein [Desulfovermiculus sp.]|nr:universal stress protein [Desulfovermiculus sp.]